MEDVAWGFASRGAAFLWEDPNVGLLIRRSIQVNPRCNVGFWYVVLLSMFHGSIFRADNWLRKGPVAAYLRDTGLSEVKFREKLGELRFETTKRANLTG
jgi:hypothetical protein